MKTKVIITTHFVGQKNYIFDDTTQIDARIVSRLSEYGVSDCRLMVSDDAEIIVINNRVPGVTCDPMTRLKAFISFFCPQGIEHVYLILHSRTDLPQSNNQRQPIGEYLGWSNDKELRQKKKNGLNIRIWAMSHEITLDRGAYILTKAAYENDIITADTVLERVKCLFAIEDINNLWNEYRRDPCKEKLQQIANSIRDIQNASFIKSLVDVDSFITKSTELQFLQIKRLTGKDPIIFSSWKK